MEEQSQDIQTEDTTPILKKEFKDLFKYASQYNEYHFHITKLIAGEQRIIGYYNRFGKIVKLMINFLDNEEIAWLALELCCQDAVELGNCYVMQAWPNIHLLGKRDKLTAIRFYINALRRMDYYMLARSSTELRETVPYLPTYPLDGNKL